MRIEKLDGLRGIFSMMLVFYHYPQEYLPAFIFNNFLLRESYTFVDFFFVLSGFVISYNYSTISNSADFFIYLKKRFIRLFPLLIYTSLVYFAYIIFVFILTFSEKAIDLLSPSFKSIRLKS